MAISNCHKKAVKSDLVMWVLQFTIYKTNLQEVMTEILGCCSYKSRATCTEINIRNDTDGLLNSQSQI